MDPNANLAEQREIANRILRRLDAHDTSTDTQAAFDQADDGERLAELVQALDEWLSSDGSRDGHGFLPRAWDNSYAPAVEEAPRCGQTLDYGVNTTRCKLPAGHTGAHSDGPRAWA